MAVIIINPTARVNDRRHARTRDAAPELVFEGGPRMMPPPLFKVQLMAKLRVRHCLS